MEDDVFVQGVSLRRLVSGSGPFVTAFLVAASNPVDVPDGIAAQVSAVPDAVRDRFFGGVAEASARSDVEAVAVVAGSDVMGSFGFREPIRRWVCRVGSYPSLGPVLEEHQLVASHAMVTVENGEYGVTTFGSVAVPDAEGRSIGVTGSLDLLVEELRFAPPRLLAVAGAEGELGEIEERLVEAFPESRLTVYPVADLDRSLDALADRLVRDAATLAAEAVAHELGVFRAAAAEALVVEGPEVMEALLAGELSAVLAHDDVDDDRRHGEDRLVDAVVATALADRVPVTMIPGVDEDRGPKGGLGGIVRATPVEVSTGADPALARGRARTEPGDGRSVVAPSA